MISKPKYLNFLAGAILFSALSLPLQLMLIYGNPPTEIAAIAAKLSPLNWLLLFSCPIVAGMVYRASRWMVATVPLLAALVVYNNWFVSQVSTEYPVWITQAASFLSCFFLFSVFSEEIRRLILKPELRWWLTPKRKAVEVTLRLRVLSGRYKSGREEFYTITFDISESGAFIPFGRAKGTVRELRPERDVSSEIDSSGSGAVLKDASGLPPGFSMNHLVPGTQCYICMNFRELAFVQCRAEVVRVNPPSGKYPGGVGIKFLGLSAREKRMINHFMEDMDDEAKESSQETKHVA
jgi:hypothetical protein